MIVPPSPQPIVSELNPVPATALITNVTLGQNSLYFQPFDVLQQISVNRLNLFLSVATTLQAANSTGSAGYTISAAMYTRGAGTASDRIGMFWSVSAPIKVTMTSNTQIVATNIVGISNATAVSTVGTSLSTSNATTYVANSIGGFRALALPVQQVLQPQRYWLAVANSTASANATCVLGASVLQQSQSNNIAWMPFGTSSAASNAGVSGAAFPGAGTYSAVSAAFPATVPLTSDSIRGPSVVFPFFNLSAATTAVNTI